MAFRKNLFLFLLFVIVALIMEIFTFLLLGWGVGPKYYLFNIAFWLTLGGLLTIFPSIVKIVVYVVLLLLHAILCGVNLSLYAVNGDIFRWETIGQAEGGVMTTPDIYDIAGIFILFLLLVVAVIGFIYIHNSIKEPKDKINKSVTALALIMAVSTPIGLVTNQVAYANINKGAYNFESWQGIDLDKSITKEDITETSEILFSEQYLYNNLQNRLNALKTFGTYGCYTKNLINLCKPSKKTNEQETINKTIEYINNGELATVNMGTSKGNNVITVLLETASWYTIDPYLTPNLYALSHTSTDDYITNSDLQFIADNTMKFENYFARNSTNVSEQLMLVGSYTYSSKAYYELYSEKAMNMKIDYSLANVLKKDTNENIVTSYYHPSTVGIYSRNYTMPTFGFDNVYLIEHMEDFKDRYPFEFYNFLLDSDFFEHYSDDLIATNGDRFYSHVSTITTHGSYLNKDARHTQALLPYYNKLIENWDKVMEYNKLTYPTLNFPQNDGSDFFTIYANYKAAMMDLDKGIGILFNQLKDGGLLNNTTVCLFGDHYCYYNDLALSIYGYGHNDFAHPEMYKIPAYIFDTKLANKLTNNYQDMGNLFNYKYSSPAVLLPTMLDILGIEYNKSYYLGASIFSDDSNYLAQVCSLNGFMDENFFSFDGFNIESSLVDDRLDYNNLKQRFYCNIVYAYTKMMHLDNMYLYNTKIFK